MRFYGNSRRVTIMLAALVAGLLVVVVVLLVAGTGIWGDVPDPDQTPTMQYLEAQEMVVVPIASTTHAIGTTTIMLPVNNVLFTYIEVTDGCGPHFEGECLNARSGPGTDFSVQRQLRNGIVLQVSGSVEREGELWYRIVFDEFIRYPERMQGDWYVHSDYVAVLYDEGNKTTWEDGAATTTEKRIMVSRDTQVLQAYDGEELFLDAAISTGLELTPTPRGTFTVYKKTPSRYMQGPLPNLADRQVYDLPGVPWNLYFTQDGAVIHGAYWHDSFGSAYSHGCVNLPMDVARTLYEWADLGTKVIVTD